MGRQSLVLESEVRILLSPLRLDVILLDNNKTITITNANDELLICLTQIKGTDDFVIVEPANGSIKAEIFNGTEPVFKDVNGHLFIDRNRFILHTD